MFEPPQNKQRSLTVPLKVLAFGAIGLIISLGLCGMSGVGHQHFQGFFMASGIVVFVSSLLLLIVGIVWFAVAALITMFRK